MLLIGIIYDIIFICIFNIKNQCYITNLYIIELWTTHIEEKYIIKYIYLLHIVAEWRSGSVLGP